MTDEIDTQHWRDRLLLLREQLQEVHAKGDQATATVELDQARVGRLSRMDALQAQAISVEAQNRREAQLKRVSRALRRLDTGEFGWCDECGEAIDLRRLDYDPTIELCIDCASLAEKRGAG